MKRTEFRVLGGSSGLRRRRDPLGSVHPKPPQVTIGVSWDWDRTIGVPVPVGQSPRTQVTGPPVALVVTSDTPEVDEVGLVVEEEEVRSLSTTTPKGFHLPSSPGSGSLRVPRTPNPRRPPRRRVRWVGVRDVRCTDATTGGRTRTTGTTTGGTRYSSRQSCTTRPWSCAYPSTSICHAPRAHPRSSPAVPEGLSRDDSSRNLRTPPLPNRGPTRHAGPTPISGPAQTGTRAPSTNPHNPWGSRPHSGALGSPTDRRQASALRDAADAEDVADGAPGVQALEVGFRRRPRRSPDVREGPAGAGGRRATIGPGVGHGAGGPPGRGGAGYEAGWAPGWGW